MPKIRINFLALQTFDRVIATSDFLEVLDKAIPDSEWQEQEALRRLAEDQQWDFGDYQVERQVLEGKYHWLPRLAAYSVVILLSSIVETQLLALAERVGEIQGSAFRVNNIGGRGIDEAILYLKRAVGLEVKKDPAWERVHDLRQLRHIIVHRGGRPSNSPKQQETVQKLAAKYKGRLFLTRSLQAPQGELWISMHLCKDFADEVQEFFERLFGECGLSAKGVEEVR